MRLHREQREIEEWAAEASRVVAPVSIRLDLRRLGDDLGFMWPLLVVLPPVDGKGGFVASVAISARFSEEPAAPRHLCELAERARDRRDAKAAP